jgi:hypothetical protein
VLHEVNGLHPKRTSMKGGLQPVCVVAHGGLRGTVGVQSGLGSVPPGHLGGRY